MVPEMFKECPECGVLKPLTDYHQNRSRPDGLGFYCRRCATARRRASTNQGRSRGEARQLARHEPGLELKWCPDCQMDVSLTSFGRNAASHDGLTAYCRRHHNERGLANKIKNHGSTRHYHLQRRYGIGEAEVDAMRDHQKGLCAACGMRQAKHVDHDHKTGKVRELLCFTCNVALGNVSDSVLILKALIAYLEKHQTDPSPAAAAPPIVRRRIPVASDYAVLKPYTVRVIELV